MRLEGHSHRLGIDGLGALHNFAENKAVRAVYAVEVADARPCRAKVGGNVFEFVEDLHRRESLDLKLQLSATDYGNFLANEPSPIATSTISEKATKKLVDEFNYVRSNAVGSLAKFLDYLT